MITRLIREPLIHFMLIAVLIFAISANRTDEKEQDKTINVDYPTLARFLQNRSPGLTFKSAEQQLKSFTKLELKRLSDEFVEQEILFREAKSLGLDQQDHTLRRGLVQKMETLLAGFDNNFQPSDEDLKSYYDSYSDKYTKAETVSFKHLFFQKGNDPEKRSKKTLDQLQKANTIHPADLFPYQRAYLDTNKAKISSHFGVEFAQRIFLLTPEPKTWQGPLKSSYGLHLVQLTSKHKGGIIPFAKVATSVQRDYLRAQRAEKRRSALQYLLKNYSIDSSIAF